MRERGRIRAEALQVKWVQKYLRSTHAVVKKTKTKLKPAEHRVIPFPCLPGMREV